MYKENRRLAIGGATCRRGELREPHYQWASDNSALRINGSADIPVGGLTGLSSPLFQRASQFKQRL